MGGSVLISKTLAESFPNVTLPYLPERSRTDIKFWVKSGAATA